MNHHLITQLHLNICLINFHDMYVSFPLLFCLSVSLYLSLSLSLLICLFLSLSLSLCLVLPLSLVYWGFFVSLEATGKWFSDY